MTGSFRCLAGTDGTGKTTVARQIASEHDDVLVFERRNTEAFGLDDDSAARIRAMSELIWDYPKDAPVRLWSDWHWMSIQLAWFHLIGSTVIQPAVDAGRTVLVDGWYHRFMARFLVKPDWTREALDTLFGPVLQPSWTYLLTVVPAVALARRPHFLGAEAGSFDGRTVDQQSFIEYQSEVASALEQVVPSDARTSIDTTTQEPFQVAEVVWADMSGRRP